MLKNYFKIAFRNLKKLKTFSVINIAGFSTSLSIVILLGLFIQNELSIDTFHSNRNEIYKVSKGTLPAQTAEMIKSNVPEVRKTLLVDLVSGGSITIDFNGTPQSIKNIVYAEPHYFDFFSFKFRQGDPKTALNTPMSMVLTETEAKRIFGKENPIGKIVKVNNQFDLTVNAVVDDIPQNSSIQFNAVVSLESLKQINGTNNDPFDWSHWNYCLYVLLPQKINHTEVIKKITSALKNNIPKGNSEVNLDISSFKDMYYESEFFGIQKRGSFEKNIVLISIAILILLIAIINYINLSIAKAITRMKEIGVRKTVGASKFFLVCQFLCESILYSLISVVFAIILAELLLPVFNEIVDSKLVLFSEDIILKCIVFVFFAIILGMLAGLYPSFYLTSFKPDTILRGKLVQNSNRSITRRGLIVFQFAIAIALIFSTITIFNQVEFMKNKPLGFKKDNIIYFQTNNEIYSNRDIFKSKILQIAAVEDFTYSFDVPGKMHMRWGMDLNHEGKKSRVWATTIFSSGEYMRIMNLKIADGRGFYENDSTDYGSIIINESFAKTYNVEKPLEAAFAGGQKIIGVVEDFNFTSLHSNIEPLIIFNAPYYNTGLIKLKSAKYTDVKSVISNLESVWTELSPDYPFEYSFLDESLANLYVSEIRFEKTFIGFSILAIFVACLGLFGLTAFMTEQKTKEIGVRKILGATTRNITVMISKQFVLLVIISNFIAIPASYYFINKWLQDFAYRIEITWWVFVLSGGIALVIALATVSFQAVKAALANPVESLRYE